MTVFRPLRWMQTGATSSFSLWFPLALRKFSLWLLVAMLAFGVLLHYGDRLPPLSAIAAHTPMSLVYRQSLERILGLFPILYATLVFGTRGGAITLGLVAAILLPRAIASAGEIDHALPETGGVLVTGLMMVLWLRAQERETQVRRRNEERLAAINAVCQVAGRSMDLPSCLESIVGQVKDVMRADAAMLHLADDKTGDLKLVAQRGVSPSLASSLAPGNKSMEGYTIVMRSGVPRLLNGASTEHTEGSEHCIQLVVPLQSRGRTIGTLAVAMEQPHRFSENEVRLMTIVGSQAGVAVENARLYQQARASEQQYRDLFENAGVAILTHALEGTITAANHACHELTGYSSSELLGMNVSLLLAPSVRAKVAETEARLARGEQVVQPFDLRQVRKDGTSYIVAMRVRPILGGNRVTGFEHIALDVTEQRRLMENWNFFLRQTLTAQEKERQRMALELHDDTVQSLVQMCQRMDSLASGHAGEVSASAAEELRRVRSVAVQTLEGLRRLIQDLRPRILDDLGLVAAVEWLMDQLTHQYGIKGRLALIGTLPDLSPEAQLILCRVAQEALSNVGHHSGATQVVVTLEADDNRVRMEIADNGRGFQVPQEISSLAAAGKLGVLGMQERARLLCGEFRLHSQPGQGTTVEVELPVGPAAFRSNGNGV